MVCDRVEIRGAQHVLDSPFKLCIRWRPQRQITAIRASCGWYRHIKIVGYRSRGCGLVDSEHTGITHRWQLGLGRISAGLISRRRVHAILGWSWRITATGLVVGLSTMKRCDVKEREIRLEWVTAQAKLKQYIGRSFKDRTIGIVWWLFTLFGAGSVLVGAWKWWSSQSRAALPTTV